MVRTLLSLYIGLCITLVLTIQGLSVLHMIALVPLLIVLVAAAAITTIFGAIHTGSYRWHLPLGITEYLHPLVAPFALMLPPIILFLCVLGWHVPPNNWDAMTYHLSRAAYWRQWHTLAHFPTNNLRQDVFPGNAEVLVLVTLLVAHSATGAFLVQFAAYLATTLAVYGLGRQLSLRPAYALIGAGAFATMPEIILQSTSSQNDLVVAAFITCTAYFFVDAVKQRHQASCVLAIVAFGLALGTKPTAILAVPGLGLGAALLTLQSLRAYGRPRLTGQCITTVLAGLLVAAALATPWYLANLTEYGNVSGPPDVAKAQAVDHSSLQTTGVNLLRYAISYVDPEGPAFLTPQTYVSTCALATQVRSALAAATHMPAVEPAIEWTGTSYSSAPVCQFNEDTSWFGLIGLLGVGIATVLSVVGLVRTARRRKISLAWILAINTCSFLLCSALLLRWQPWQGRLLVVVAALSAPLLGLVAARVAQRRLGRLCIQILVLYAVATGFSTAIDNVARPLNAWGASRSVAQVLTRPEMGLILTRVNRDVPAFARLGIFINGDDWDFPLFGPHLDREIEPLVLPSSVQDELPYGQGFDHLLTHQPVVDVRLLLRYLPTEQCHREWSTGGALPWMLFTCLARAQRASHVIAIRAAVQGNIL